MRGKRRLGMIFFGICLILGVFSVPVEAATTITMGDSAESDNPDP